MANSFTQDIIVDGSRNTIVHYVLTGDGSQDFTNTLLYDASAAVNTTTSLKLWAIKYGLNGFSGQLIFDGGTPQPFYTMVKDKDTDQCFEEFGGYVNDEAVTPTGDILLTTQGMVGAPTNGYITLYLKKRTA